MSVLRPLIPHNDAGCLIDPPVSVPEAAGNYSCCYSSSRASRTSSRYKFISPWVLDISIISLFHLRNPLQIRPYLSLPTDMHPAFSRFSITVAEYGGMKFESIFEPHVVLRSFVQKRSFCAIGMPARACRRWIFV